MTTLDYYNLNAKAFVDGTVNANMEEHYKQFIEYLNAGARVLDLGCGSGRDSLAFQKMCYEVVAVDGSEEVCKEARVQTGIDVQCMKFEELSYQGEFDGVWACASLLHVEKSAMHGVLNKVSNALKKSGVLYCSYKYGTEERTANGRFFNDYNENDIPELFEDTGLKCEKWWISCDVRPGRADEKWLNIICKKN